MGSLPTRTVPVRNRRTPRSRLALGIALGLWLGGLLLARSGSAGNGAIGTDGKIDLTVNVRFVITPTGLTELRQKLTDASKTLWDATEGQMRFRKIRITCTPVGEDLADYWILTGPLRSNASLDGVGKRGYHVNMYFPEDGMVYAHEFGHYGLSLGDEYEENVKSCGGQGPCISESPDETSDVDQCLMQQTFGRDGSEFCVKANHDPLRGNATSCAVNPPNADGTPCKSNCAAWNTDTGRYETSRQSTYHGGESCWETLARKFPFLHAPAGRPQAAPPAGFVDPDFEEQCHAADTITLLLDTSTSMEESVAGANKEVCGNKFDDDGDGKVDEPDDCSESRMEFVKAAARGFLDLGTVLPFRVNLVSFDSSVREHVAFVDVLPALPRLQAAVDGLKPGGLTAIGWGLDYSRTLIEGSVSPSATKAVLLITDGNNSAGPDPATVLPDLQKAGIRVYALGTGDAANSKVLNDISAATRGSMLSVADPSALVTTAAQQWATYANLGVVVPERPYAVDRTGQEGGTAPPKVTVSFPVETGTQRFVAVLAGSLHDMSGFGVRAVLRSPSGALFDSSAPPAQLAVTDDRFFTFLTLSGPEAGPWQLEISGKTTAAHLQTGRLLVLADDPQADLFADLDKTVLGSATDTAELSLSPYYFSGLKDVDWDVRLHRPDGTEATLAVTPGNTPYVYRATVSGFPYAGPYDLDVTLRTIAATTNDPGESRPGTAPPNTRPIPLFERHLRLSLFRPGTDWYCRPEQDDCDGDGVRGESRSADGDHDGIPDAWDTDSNNDEIPDGVAVLHHSPARAKPAREVKPPSGRHWE